MKQVRICRLSFSSYMKFFLISGVSSGTLAGLLLFAYRLLRFLFQVDVDFVNIFGLTVGVVSLVISPLLGGLIYLWIAAITYIPFRLCLKIFKKVRFTALIEDVREQANIRENIEVE